MSPKTSDPWDKKWIGRAFWGLDLCFGREWSEKETVGWGQCDFPNWLEDNVNTVMEVRDSG